MGNNQNDPSLSWFCVFNNPQDHGYEGDPRAVIEKLKNEWITEDHPERSGAWIYCKSADGLPHIHMVLCSKTAIRFSAIKKNYASGAHFEKTRGTKDQVMNYIEKKPPFDEKGEIILEKLVVGQIIGRPKKDEDNTYSTIYEEIDDYIDRGFTPDQLFDMSSRFLKYESIIKRAYQRTCKRNLGSGKKYLTVYYHVGKAGSGKSYTYYKLLQENKSVYLCTDFANGGISAFDGYMAQPALFIDDLKPTSFPYQTLLMILDEKISSIHARYQNVDALWTEIHITSVYSPTQLYDSMVPEDMRKIDTKYQLLRRINFIVYHYQVGESFETYTIPMSGFVNMTTLHQDAQNDYNARHKQDCKELSNAIGLPVTAVTIN